MAAIPKKTIYWTLGGLATLVVWARWKRRGEAPPNETLFDSVKEAVRETKDEIRVLVDRGAWTRRMYQAISESLPPLPAQSKLVIIAHAVTESGWASQSRAVKNGYNYWNITAGSSWTGPVYVDVNGDKSYQKTACKSLGRPMDFKDSKGRAYCKIDQKWRSWPSLEAAVRGYWDFMGGRYIAAREALIAGDIPTFVTKLAEKGYFDPAVKGEYLTNMQSIIKRAGSYVA